MSRKRVIAFVLLSTVLFLTATAAAQAGKGSISGRVVDSGGAVLQGARIDLQPGGAVAVTNQLGEFTFSDVALGEYTITVHYIGFATSSNKVTVTAGKMARADTKLQVASKNEEIVVTAERAHGEAEAINRQRDSDNILQVLPVDVITSLPNTNIADAVGRLPSVTLERDEGEGKYIQIRGTEPRLNNVTINGVEVPSPEGDVRQIKLDVIPANLIDSVELNKTLSANQNAGAIGGSVDLVTKTAGERPTLYLNGMGGYTPIIGGRSLDEFDGTVGQRFGASKKLGILFGASYDWNGRGIDDVEPVPTAVGCGGGQCIDFIADPTSATGPFFPSYDTEDIREYRYYRTRYGFTGNVDYKLEDTSGVYVNFLYSHFKNFGDRWVYSPTVGTFFTPTMTNANGTTSFNAQIRRPVEVIGSLQAGGKHVIRQWLVLYEIAASRSSSEDKGYSSADFSPDVNNNTNPLVGSVQYAIDPNAHTPKLIPQGGVNIFDPTLYTMSDIDFNKTYSPQLNLEGSFSIARNYMLGSHFGTFEFGARVRNAHKFQDEFDPVWNIDPSVAPLMASFTGTFTNSGYYYSAYPGAFNSPQVNYDKIRAFFNANPSLFIPDTQGTQIDTLTNNYDLIERVTAGYLMNTLQFGRVRLQTGLRFEATNEDLLGNQVGFDQSGNTTFTGISKHNSYLDPLPSVQVRFALGNDTAIRASYGRGIARPNFMDLPPIFDITGKPDVSIGNPDLKPTHSNNYDLLFEKYLQPLGVIQAGFFFKQLSDPIYEGVAQVITAQVAQQNPLLAPYVHGTVTQPINGQSAHLYGFEIAYQQHLSFLPGAFAGIGISANYGYTASSTVGVPFRTDLPSLQRQAPNTFNFSPTYDRGRISARLGVSYNGPYIWSYAYSNLVADPSSQSGVSPNFVPLGKHGPFGDIYLYQHTQVDAQASYRVYHGLQFVVAGLNLTNAMFGFYQGSPIFPIQREYYKPSYEFGLRYTYTSEK